MQGLLSVLFWGLLLVMGNGSLYAAVFSVTGPVAAVGTVIFTPGLHLSNNFQTAIFSGYSVGSLQIDSNSPSGFRLTVSSANGGKFIRYVSGVAVGSPATGDQVDYTITFTDGSGTLGTAPGTMAGPVAFLGIAHSLPVVGSAYVFDFASATQATLAKKFGVTLAVNSGQAPQHLFNSEGTDIYKDTITITIANL
jgi:hypothetical protein